MSDEPRTIATRPSPIASAIRLGNQLHDKTLIGVGESLLRRKEREREAALSRILEQVRIVARQGRNDFAVASAPTDLAAIAAELPAFVAKLNDAELRILRDGLREIARESVAAAQLRSMVRQQFDLALEELAAAW